ncbi:hypothetical protein AB7828_05460 [Tardiphaga sp. 215_C5_N2_1]|uniref:hypothetical protein n=1 Tax=Tardiphaga sp. 215_C5_N2_1 TaxID=3240774 RepID=UPI003F8C5F0A
MEMDVSRTDCGGITGAGEYRFRDGHLIVTLYQIAIWAEYPQAIFTAVTSRFRNSMKLYVLASWRLPNAAPSDQPPAPASEEGMSLH